MDRLNTLRQGISTSSTKVKLLSYRNNYKDLIHRGIYVIFCRVGDWKPVNEEIAAFLTKIKAPKTAYLVKIGMSERELRDRLDEHRLGNFKGSDAELRYTFEVPEKFSCVYENVINNLSRRMTSEVMLPIPGKKDYYVLDDNYALAYEAFLDQIFLDMIEIKAMALAINSEYGDNKTKLYLFTNAIMATPEANKRATTRSSKVDLNKELARAK